VANAAGVTAMFDTAIIIASIRMLVAVAVTLVLFLFFIIKKHHLTRFKARILRLNAFAR